MEKNTNCQVCGNELEEFDEDHLICRVKECPSNNLGWNRLIPKEIKNNKQRNKIKEGIAPRKTRG